MMLQIKFDSDRLDGFRDINVLKCGRTHRKTHGPMPAQSHPLSAPYEPSAKVSLKECATVSTIL